MHQFAVKHECEDGEVGKGNTLSDICVIDGAPYINEKDLPGIPDRSDSPVN